MTTLSKAALRAELEALDDEDEAEEDILPGLR